MPAVTGALAAKQECGALAVSHFEDSLNRVHRRTDRMFARLMVAQWLAGVAAALWISPRTWIGDTSQVHLHVWTAILLGGALTAFPVFMVRKHAGHALTRHVIAFAQMMTSALLIHLSGGRIETHFHVFGSLAFLAFYRDRRVLVTATLVVTLDHLTRGLLWPQSVFGVLSAGSWRWAEHAGWVLFENVFLFISIRQGLEDMRDVARRRAELEMINQDIERQIVERTAEFTSANKELQARENHLRMILKSEPECVKLVDANGTLLDMNPAGLAMIEADDAKSVLGQSVYGLVAPEYHEMFQELNDATFAGESRTAEFEIVGLKGTRRWMETHACPLRDADGNILAQLAITRDITDRRTAQAEIERMHKDLVSASRQAGMAEVATGVLHNVGNVLNSVNIACCCLAEIVRNSKSANLSKVAVMLTAHESDLARFLSQDPKGRQLPRYLSQLAEHLAGEQSSSLRELDHLQKKIEHIKDIVARQQSYAKVSGTVENVAVADLIDDALKMNASSLMRHDIQIIREFEKVPSISTDKHKVLQVLVNLISNAKRACDDSGKPAKRLVIRLRHERGGVAILVRDNGIGIAPENLTQIFSHGFTTKKDGHGFGLHSCALAARELGGSLAVHSEGQGRGAEFKLELPLTNNSDRLAA